MNNSTYIIWEWVKEATVYKVTERHLIKNYHYQASKAGDGFIYGDSERLGDAYSTPRAVFSALRH